MKTILIRSPYFIEVNEATQVGSKIELFIWHKGETEPTAPTYTLSKKVASASQTKNEYNISNYAKEYINIIYPDYVYTPDSEDYNQWCFIKVKRYVEETTNDFTLLDETTYIGLNGYSDYTYGYNYYIETPEILLTLLQNNKTYKYFYNEDFIPYINFLAGDNAFYYSVRYSNLDGSNVNEIEIIDTPSNQLFKVPITYIDADYSNGNKFEILQDGAVQYTITFIPECENKYTPMLCSYINRFGCWDFITFFKARIESFDVKNKEYQLLPNDLNYNIQRGESKFFNYEAKQSIKINTGWVNEYYNDLIKDLMTSEIILLNGNPVKLKTMTTDLKTSLQDKMINYTIDFEYNYNQINNVI